MVTGFSAGTQVETVRNAGMIFTGGVLFFANFLLAAALIACSLTCLLHLSADIGAPLLSLLVVASHAGFQLKFT